MIKVITKRHGQSVPLKDAAILQRTMNRLRNYDLVPKGLYRFTTFEEADQWLIGQIAATHAHRKLTI